MTIKLPFRSATVVFKEMDDGGVLFCSRTEVYFGLNRVGATIWRHLPDLAQPDTSSLDDLLDALQEIYPDVDRDTLSGDVREFLEAMAEGELVANGAPTQA